jgi:hypothetical protein
MSAFDRSRELAVSPDGLSCQSRNQKDWHGARSNKGVAGRGRFYYEASVQDEGLCRLGFSTTEVSCDQWLRHVVQVQGCSNHKGLIIENVQFSNTHESLYFKIFKKYNFQVSKVIIIV